MGPEDSASEPQRPPGGKEPLASLPPEAGVVIIGGGIAGCALAYHLADLGARDVVLLEQNQLGAGTTWHAAGAVGRMRTSASLARLNDRSAALYARVAAESGLPTGWHQAGGLTVARCEDRMIQLRRAGTLATRFGVNVHEVGPDEIKSRWPLALFDDVIGGVWLPEDGSVEPLLLTRAVASEARKHGVNIFESVRVTELVIDRGRVIAVRTERGLIRCEAAVICAGMWAHQLTEGLGIQVPLQPVEHHYVLSKPLGQDLDGLPVVRDPDGSIYFRGRGEAIMLGAFQQKSKPWLVERIPDDFAFRLLDPDWEHFSAPLEEGLRRFPNLQSIGIAKFVNGPESFTPDGNPLVGEVPGVRRLYVSAGFNSSGLAYGGGVGEMLAQWIIGDQAPCDLWPIDIRRFRPEQSTRSFLLDRGVEVLGTHLRMAYPNVEFSRGRNLIQSPLFDRLAGAGAWFGEKQGVERPAWFATDGQAPVTEYSFGRQNWFPFSRAEHLATRNDVAIFDQSGFGKFLIEGRDALALLQRCCANDLDVEVGGVVYTAMLTDRGTFASDLTVIRTGSSQFLAVTGTAQVVADRDWLGRQAAEGEEVGIKDLSLALATLGLMGPKSRPLLASLTGADLSNDAFPFGTSREIDLAGIRCRAVRITYVGELGWEVYVDAAEATKLYDALWTAGRAHGLANAGHYAINSLRLEKGYRAFGADITMDDTPLEAGLGFAVAWNKSVPFKGREALTERRAKGIPDKRMVSLVLEDPEPYLWGGELIFRNGECVGHTTSGAYGHTLGSAVALGYLRAPGTPIDTAFISGTRFDVEVDGVRFPARASLSAPYDPQRSRILS